MPGFPCCLRGGSFCLSCYHPAGEGEHQLSLPAAWCSGRHTTLAAWQSVPDCIPPQRAALPPLPGAGEERHACLLPCAALQRPLILSPLMLILEVVHRSRLICCPGGVSFRASERKTGGFLCSPGASSASKDSRLCSAGASAGSFPQLIFTHSSCQYLLPLCPTPTLPRPLCYCPGLLSDATPVHAHTPCPCAHMCTRAQPCVLGDELAAMACTHTCPSASVSPPGEKGSKGKGRYLGTILPKRI